MTVLVLTREFDAVADLVIAELNARGTAVHRLDPAGFPTSLVLDARVGADGIWHGEILGGHRDLSLDSVHAVYNRRPGRHRPHPAVADQDRDWACEEARAAFRGVLNALDRRWVNHPDANKTASSKPGALAAAMRCGLRVPRTLITNDPARAREFVAALPGRVAAYKPLGEVHPADRDGRVQALWTTRVCAGQIGDAAGLTAHQWQEWIDKAFEVRLTVVDGRMFAAEIHAGSEVSRVDFRADYDSLTYRVCEVPRQVADEVRELMGVFGLRYAALDFLVNQTGAWHLVDLNPNGQFGFIPELRAPITEALADLLEGPSR